MKLYEDTFWGRVKMLSARNGLSMKALADKAEISYVTLTNQITKDSLPKKIGVKEAMAKALGTTVDFLMNGDAGDTGARNGMGPEILELIDNYRLIDRDKQKAVLTILDALVMKQREEDRADADAMGTEL